MKNIVLVHLFALAILFTTACSTTRDARYSDRDRDNDGLVIGQGSRDIDDDEAVIIKKRRNRGDIDDEEGVIIKKRRDRDVDVDDDDKEVVIKKKKTVRDEEGDVVIRERKERRREN